MDSNSARLVQDVHDLAEQLRFLAAALTSSRTRLSGGEFFIDSEPVNVEALSHFKAALDHARHSVWALLEVLGVFREHGNRSSAKLSRAARQRIAAYPAAWPRTNYPIRRRRAPSLRKSRLWRS